MQANNEMQASVDQVAIRTKSSSAEPQLKAQHSYVASANSSQANRASKQPIYGMTKSNSLDTQVSDAPLFELAPSRRLRKFVFVVILLIGMLVFVLSLSSLLYLPTFVSNKVSNVLVLRNNSLMLDRWSKPDAPMFFKVWMFDIQNPSELLQASAQANNQSAASAGAPRQARHVRPVLREVGPFVFRLRRVKDVVSISNETLYYTERKVYFFDEAASCCSINTTVTVPNIPLAAIVDRASNVNVPLVKRIVPRLVNRAVQSLREQVFVKRQVRELLFDGYDVELLKMVSLVGSLVGITPPNGQKFALFLGKNNTWRPDVDGVWALNTGAVDRKKFGRVSSWNAHKTLPFWPAPACNAINGSDGTLFPPPISTREPLYIFNPDLCRTVNMIYDRPSSVRSIPAYRFILNPANFAPSLAGASSTGVAQRRLDSQMRRAGGEQRTPLLRRARQRLDESLSNRLRANRLAAAVGGNDKQIDEQRRHVALTQQAVERRRDSFAKRHASDTPPPQLSTGALPAGAAQVLNPAVQSPAARSPSKPGPTSPGALSCFCERKNVELGGANVCEFDGIIDMSRCQKNAAVIFGSPPHFSRADPRLRRSVLGLAPNASLHTSYLDIEPNTGLVMAGKRRVQLNLLMRRNADIDGYENISDILMPILWLEESAMIGENVALKLKKMYFERVALVRLILVSLLVGSLIVLLLDLRLLCNVCSPLKLPVASALIASSANVSSKALITQATPSQPKHTAANEEYANAAKRTFDRLRAAQMAVALRAGHAADASSGTPLMAAVSDDSSSDVSSNTHSDTPTVLQGGGPPDKRPN